MDDDDDDDRRPKKHPRRRRIVSPPPPSSSFSCPAAAVAAAMTDDRRPPRRRRLVVVCPLLPFDIVLHHILVLLPAISLLRFRSVCKSWLSAISDPRFIASHSVKSPPLLLFRTGRRSDLYLYDYTSGNHKTLAIKDLLPVEEYIHLVHVTPSVNGLVLLYSTQHIHTRDAYTRIHICNPCTRQIVTLPRLLDVDLGELDVSFDHIQWDNKSVYYCEAETLWFGSDPSTGKYKVVHFMAAKGMTTTSSSSSSSLCHVFTQGGDCWREVSPSPPFVCLEKYPVSLKGVLYGTANTRPSPPNGMILSFDLTKEKLASIPPPPNLNGVGAGFSIMHGLRTIIVLQEKLSVVDCPNDDTMAIWMLKDQQNNNNIRGGGGKYEWSKVYSFDIPIPPLGSQQVKIKRVIPTREGNFLLGTTSYPFLSFDPNTKSLSNLLAPKEQYKYWLKTSFPSRGSLDIGSLAVTTPYTETLEPAG